MEYRVNTKGLVLPNDETHVDWFLLAIAERLERIAELMEHSDEHQQDIEAKLLTFGQEEEPWRERDEAHPDLGLHPVWDDNLE